MGKWKEKKLADIVVKMHQGINTAGDKVVFEKEGYPIIQARNMTNENIDFHNIKYLSNNDWLKYKEKHKPNIGDILFSNIGTIGKSVVVKKDIDYLIHWNIFKIEVKEDIVSSDFLKQHLDFLTSFNYWDKFQKGGTVKFVNKKVLNDIPIPIPPLAEQQRVVAKLDGLFAKLDQSISLLEENISQTQALMGSVLDEIYSNGDTMLKDVCIVGPKKSEVKDVDNDLEISFLPMRDLNEHEINFIPKETKKISEVYKGYTYFTDGDIILAKVTPCFENGKAGLAKDLTNGIGFGSSEYHILRPKENVLPEWIYFAVLTEQFRVTGKENMTGAGGLKRIPRPFVEEWKIPVPKLSIQKKQVARIVKIQEETKQLEVSIQEKLNHLKALKGSLLDQAFNGEL